MEFINTATGRMQPSSRYKSNQVMNKYKGPAGIHEKQCEDWGGRGSERPKGGHAELTSVPCNLSQSSDQNRVNERTSVQNDGTQASGSS
eukprot:8105223-Karenia_brevis.AAC.1